MPRNRLLTTTKPVAGSQPNAAELAAADALLKAAAEVEAKAKADADAAAKAAAQTGAGTYKDRVNSIADALEADEDFVSEVEQTFAAADIKARGPCAYLVMLERDLNDDQLASLPTPGTNMKTSQNPDSYTDEIGGIKVRSSYYKDLARRLPGGREEQAHIVACDQFTRNNPLCPDEYKAMSKQEIVDLSSQADKRLTNLATTLRKAVNLRNQMILIEEKLPKVVCKLAIVKDKDGNESLRQGPTPIHLYDLDTPTDGEFISADTCLGFRVDAAAKETGKTQYKALKFSGGKQTAGRAGGGAQVGSPAAAMAKRVTTWAKALEYMQELGAFFGNDANDKLILNGLSKDDSDANVITYGDLLANMDAKFSGPTEERYKRLKIAQQDARNKADAEKAKQGATK